MLNHFVQFGVKKETYGLFSVAYSKLKVHT